MVDGERSWVQGDPCEPSALLGSWRPPLHQHSWLRSGVPVCGGGPQFPADHPGCKCFPRLWPLTPTQSNHLMQSNWLRIFMNMYNILVSAYNWGEDKIYRDVFYSWTDAPGQWERGLNRFQCRLWTWHGTFWYLPLELARAHAWSVCTNWPANGIFELAEHALKSLNLNVFVLH